MTLRHEKFQIVCKTFLLVNITCHLFKFFQLWMQKSSGNNFMHLMSLWQIWFCKNQFISICGRFNEIDCRAKGKFRFFGFSQLINETDFSSKALKIAAHFFLFLELSFKYAWVLLIYIAIIITSATNVLNFVLWFSLKNY